MRSRASFCNAAIYRKNLTRFAPLWIAYLLLVLLLLPLNVYSRGSSAYAYEVSDLLRQVLRSALGEGCLLNLVYACALAMCFHGWMYRDRSVNALAALPIRRETFFCTNLLSALTVSLLPNLLAALLTWGAAAALGLPGFLAAAQWLGVMTLEFLFFYGAAALCAAVVGQLLALPGLYVLVNFAVVVLNYVVATILETFVYGLPRSGHTALARFSPAFYILGRMERSVGHTIYDSVYVASPVDLVNAQGLPWRYCRYFLVIGAVGIALLAAAFFLLRIRRMERAGSLTVFRPLRPVLKYSFTAGCALVLGLLAADVFFASSAPRLWILVLCMLAGGLVGYFTAEILLKKSFRVFRREWIGFAAFAACLLVCVGAMELDLFGYERRVPDAADVESVTLSGTAFSGNVVLSDEAHIVDLLTLHQSLIAEKEDQEAMAQQWNDWLASDRAMEETIDYAWVELVYQLKNGGTLARSYRIYCTEQQWLDAASLGRRYADLLRDPYFIQLGNTPTFDLNLGSACYTDMNYYSLEEETWRYDAPSLDEAFALYQECVAPDLRDGRVGYRAPYSFEDRSDVEYAAELTLAFQHTVEKPTDHGPELVVINSFHVDITPTVGSRTAARLEELGYSLCLKREMDDQLDEALLASPVK